MPRKLFCEISPFTYRLSMEKEILKRHLMDYIHKIRFARERTTDNLPVVIYRHNSLIRRRLGNVNMQLQENKATNLALLSLETDWTNHRTKGIQGGTCHCQRCARTGYRRRSLPTFEPHSLDGSSQRPDHRRTSSSRRARPIPRLWSSDSFRHGNQHLV